MDCNDGNCTGLFYSRRIGRAPQGSAERRRRRVLEAPDAATIIGAAKLTGRVGKFSVGALTAVTARGGRGDCRRDEVGYREQTVEPLTGYTRAARAPRVREPVERSGFMMTSTNRAARPTTCSFLPDDAYTGGVDYDWRLSPMYSVTGYWAGSHVAGSTEAITRLQENTVHALPAARRRLRRASTRPRRRSAATPARCRSARSPARRTRFSSYVGYKTPGFDINDLGFQRRADETHDEQLVPVARQRAGPVRAHLQLSTSTSGRAGTSAAIAPIRGGNINTHWTCTNNYSIGFGVNLNAAPFRDRVTRGGPGVLGNPSTERLVLRRHRQPQGAVVQLQRLPLRPTARTRRGTTSTPGVNLARRRRRCRSSSASATTSTTTMRSG